MGADTAIVYEQVMEKTRDLNIRSGSIWSRILPIFWGKPIRKQPGGREPPSKKMLNIAFFKTNKLLYYLSIYCLLQLGQSCSYSLPAQFKT